MKIRHLVALAAPPALAVAMLATGAAASTAGSAPDYQHACAATVPPGRATCLALVRTNVASHKGVRAEVTPEGYGPSSLQSAYKLAAAAAASGKGQTVAIVDAGGDPDIASDLAVYRKQYGLPACGSGCFTQVNEAGGTSLPSVITGWPLEISLDVDMVSAICPNCRILLVEADSDYLSDLGASVNEAVALGARYVSNSYAGPESSGETAYDSDYDHPGVAITVAAGDDGYQVNYPASSQFVTAVGGTTLTQASNARGWTETVWGDGESGTSDGTGSGCSAFEAKPAWQTDTGCADRTVADVSADANPNTGAAVYDTEDEGGWLEVGGTSEATPIIASTYALAGPPGASDTASEYPYEHTSSLFDVTQGSNGTCGTYLCNAQAGYDGPTGWGTPDGTAAFQAVDNTVTVTSPAAQASIKGEKATPLTITAADSDSSQTLTYSAAGLPAGLSISSSTGSISGTPTAAGTSSVTVSATDDTGATGSAAFTWKVTANTITVTSPGPRLSRKGSRITPLAITATDSESGQTLVDKATGLPRGLSITSAGIISGTPSSLTNSRVTVTVTDSTGAKGSAAFTWRVDSEGAIKSGLSAGRCVADSRGHIEIARCDGARSQRWLASPEANGTVTISQGTTAGPCVTVAGSRTASGTRVIASRCVITTSQEWTAASHGHLAGKHSGKCLADPAGGPNGTQLQIASCKTRDSQRWDLP